MSSAKEQPPIAAALLAVADRMSNAQIQADDEADTIIIAIVSLRHHPNRGTHALNP